MSKIKKSTIEVFWIWKSVHNPNFNCGEFAVIMSFKPLEFDGFKNSLDSTATAKQWIEKDRGHRTSLQTRVLRLT